jgi:hypothetical protein
VRGTTIRVLSWCSVLALSACSGSVSGKAGAGANGEPDRSKPVPLERRKCDGGTDKVVDVNNDKRPDIRHVLVDGKRSCSEIDMNFDGMVDVIRFYEKDGTTIAFEQHDYDFDGRVDEQSLMTAGAIERRELDTNFDGLVDTWMWCKGPYVERAERSRRKPGRVDTWETYSNGLMAEIKYDENNDGQPEKWEVFQAGSLSETRYDTNADGSADQTEPTAGEQGNKDKPVSCDGTPFPVQETAGPAPNASAEADAPAPANQDGTDTAADSAGTAGGEQPAAESEAQWEER